jgi:hypothetical protein
MEGNRNRRLAKAAPVPSSLQNRDDRLPEFISHLIFRLPHLRAGRTATVTAVQRSLRHRIACDDNYLDSRAVMHLQNGLARRRFRFRRLSSARAQFNIVSSR